MSAAGKKKTALSRAVRLFKKRKFAETIRILEPQIFAYRENPRYYYCLGMSCLYTGDYAGADSFLKRCVQLDFGQTNARLGLAVVHLRRNETQESLRIWLEILETDPKNRYARQGLGFVKKSSGPEDIDNFFDSRKDLSLVPSPGFFLPFWAKCLLAVLILLFALVPGGLILKERFFQNPDPARPEIAEVIIGADDVVLDTEIRAVNMMTEQEIRTTFESIKDLFDRYEDNLARREINRLLLSNAGRAVKNKIQAFIPYIRTPTFAHFPESFTYQEVVKAPLLYEGCFIRWKGRISNVVISEDLITFDFLVGYQDQKFLQGIVPARMDFAAKLEPAFAYELIGRVAPASPGITLQILSLHELGL
jgi:tetratricopeptide (TPR) repeat protein